MIIPEFVKTIEEKLRNEGFEAYIVGGSVRDLLMGKVPSDWDMTTDALPEEVLKVFPDGKYENDFGTVILPFKNEAGETENVVEITTYRSERGYSDSRHPDEVVFEKELSKDLERRDFTVNAMAIGSGEANKALFAKEYFSKDGILPEGYGLIDLFGGQKDLGLKMIRAVGEPDERFREDALRMLRAVRFACQLGFVIEPKTERAIARLAGSIRFVAKERIRDEFVKIMKSGQSYEGIMSLRRLKLLQYILPELLLGEGMEQNHHHIYSVFRHSVLSLKHCPSADWRVRLAALMHDIGKPKTKVTKDGAATFYNHEYAGERIARKVLSRLKFSNEDTEKICVLIRNHMFYYDAEEVTAASVRRLIRKVGKENLKDLIDIRIADRLGSGTPKAKPYKLRHLEYMFERVQNDPVSVKMLKISGNELMPLLGIPPGPKIGAILDCLLSEVIENPEQNTLEHLSERAAELAKLDLEELREKAKEVIEEKREEEDEGLKKGFHVK